MNLHKVALAVGGDDTQSADRFAGKMVCCKLTSKMPPKAADLAADLGPVRSCRKPPVRAPAAMEFQGSSYIEIWHFKQDAVGSFW